MARKADGPTARIIERAEAQHGAIRWSEAEAEYISASEKARRHAVRGERNHCMWLKAVFDRHFVHVEGDGSRGLYFMKRFMCPEESDKVRAPGEEWTAKDRMVRLIEMRDPWTRVPAGTLGKVVGVDGLGTLHVAWTTGHHLGLIPGEDRWEELR